jgi:hypothetical protein
MSGIWVRVAGTWRQVTADAQLTSFTGSGSYVIPNAASTARILVVAGGGGAGTRRGGEGGGRQLVDRAVNSGETLTITVGGGGGVNGAGGGSGVSGSFGTVSSPGGATNLYEASIPNGTFFSGWGWFGGGGGGNNRPAGTVGWAGGFGGGGNGQDGTGEPRVGASNRGGGGGSNRAGGSGFVGIFVK